MASRYKISLKEALRSLLASSPHTKKLNSRDKKKKKKWEADGIISIISINTIVMRNGFNVWDWLNSEFNLLWNPNGKYCWEKAKKEMLYL